VEVRKGSKAVALVASSLFATTWLSACSSDAPAVGASKPSAHSSPFSVSDLPPGWKVAVAGMGTATQQWDDDDEVDVDKTYAILSRKEATKGQGDVRVMFTGFAGNQGGLEQASSEYMGDLDEFVLDGHRAIFAKGGTRTRQGTQTIHTDPDLLVVRGDNLAVEVTGPGATRTELIAIERATVVHGGHSEAPDIRYPPKSFKWVGSVSADGLLGLQAMLRTGTDEVPGGPGAHSIGWVQGRSELTLSLIPGRALSVDAALRDALIPDWWEQHEPVTVRRREIDGRPGFEVAARFNSTMSRTVVTQMPWGDVAVATSSFVPDGDRDHATTFAQLRDVVASIKPIDDVAWDRFVVAAGGEPGLHADPGRREITRGEVGGIRWLLQNGKAGESASQVQAAPSSRGTEALDGAEAADRCLKLSTGERVCVNGWSGGGDSVVANGPAANGVPAFTTISTRLDGSRVRVIDPKGSTVATAPLARVPGASTRAAVVFMDVGRFQSCAEFDHGPPVGRTYRIQVLDGAGHVTGCLGGL
jgi:hypothetical protein